MGFLPSGVCRFCKCTETEPCTLQDGEACGWIDKDRNCCNNPACQRAKAALLRRYIAPRKRLTPMDVHKDIVARGRSKKKRRAA